MRCDFPRIFRTASLCDFAAAEACNLLRHWRIRCGTRPSVSFRPSERLPDCSNPAASGVEAEGRVGCGTTAGRRTRSLGSTLHRHSCTLRRRSCSRGLPSCAAIIIITFISLCSSLHLTTTILNFIYLNKRSIKSFCMELKFKRFFLIQVKSKFSGICLMWSLCAKLFLITRTKWCIQAFFHWMRPALRNGSC